MPTTIDQQFFHQAENAWDISWTRYFRTETNLFYDYVSSQDPAHSQDHLPTPEEVRRQFPNTCGWGTGMEDSAISAGVWMATVCDRFDATGDAGMKAYADQVWAGMELLMKVSKSPGFLPRSVCLTDGESHYINSSRDQYTHYCHALWKFYHSPLADEAQRDAMRTISADICARMERNVTPENNYSFCREDGTPGEQEGDLGQSVNKMWEVWHHEWARLPMIYAIGWDLTGEAHWREQYLRTAWHAARKSVPPADISPDTVTVYGQLQAIFSFEPLVAIEREDRDLHAAWLDVMRRYADAMQVYTPQCLDCRPVDRQGLEMDWRKRSMCERSNGPWPTWPDQVLHEMKTVREPAEAILSQLMVPGRPLSADQSDLLKHMLLHTDFDAGLVYSLFYVIAAYWRAVKRGVLRLP